MNAALVTAAGRWSPYHSLCACLAAPQLPPTSSTSASKSLSRMQSAADCHSSTCRSPHSPLTDPLLVQHTTRPSNTAAATATAAANSNYDLSSLPAVDFNRRTSRPCR